MTKREFGVPDIPTGWRNLTAREMRRLKKGEIVEVVTPFGVEKRPFKGWTETKLPMTDVGGCNYVLGKHRLVTFSPQMETMHEILAYDS